MTDVRLQLHSRSRLSGLIALLATIIFIGLTMLIVGMVFGLVGQRVEWTAVAVLVAIGPRHPALRRHRSRHARFSAVVAASRVIVVLGATWYAITA